MKKYIAFICLLLPLFSYTQTSSQLDEDSGFMHYKFDQPADSMGGLLKRKKVQKLWRYIPKADTVYFQDIPFKSVNLYFFQGSLHSIELQTAGKHSPAFKKWLEERYGKGDKRNTLGSQIYWQAEKVDLIFEEDLISHTATITFTHLDTHRAYLRFWYGEEE